MLVKYEPQTPKHSKTSKSNLSSKRSKRNAPDFHGQWLTCSTIINGDNTIQMPSRCHSPKRPLRLSTKFGSPRLRRFSFYSQDNCNPELSRKNLSRAMVSPKKLISYRCRDCSGDYILVT